MPQTVSAETVRAQFPSLESGFAFLENAGGSQVPRQVFDRINTLLSDGYVQTGAGYPASDVVDQVVLEAKAFANVLMNGEGVGTTVIGPSTTDLIYRLAHSLEFKPGDEVVISIANHESNIGPWARLEKRGVTVKWWGVDSETGAYSYDALESLLSAKTKLVAVPHTSNLLGDILDVTRVCAMVRAVGAISVVDGVANAPHAAIDVRASGADFYVLSLYKVFGPHIGLMFGRNERWEEVIGPNHFFFAGQIPAKFELGCQPYELLAGMLGTADYLAWLGQGRHDRATAERAYAQIGALERPILERLGTYLSQKPSIRLVGPTTDRHPTFSFIHKTKPSDEIVKAVNGPDLGIRYGHMYAHRLCQALGAPVETGFVRVSAVHYNTVQEADRLIAKLEEVL